MPVASITAARDEILGRLKTALDGSPYTEFVQVIWDDVRNERPGDQDMTDPVPPAEPEPKIPPALPWMRVLVQHGPGTQASLGSINGKRRQEMEGIVTVAVFTPHGAGQVRADEIVQVILDCWRTGGSTASGISFRNARFREISKNGPWMQTNVLADFLYDQIA